MRPVYLYTASGEFVIHGSIPNFLPGAEAEILVWGSRVFKLKRNDVGEPVVSSAREGALIYKEVFAVALVNTDMLGPTR